MTTTDDHRIGQAAQPGPWRATLGPTAIALAEALAVDGVTITGREAGGGHEAMGALARALEATGGRVGKRAAASIRTQASDLVALVGALNPKIGFELLPGLRVILGQPPSPVSTMALAKALRGHEPTGVSQQTGEPVWRSFASESEWVNKAQSWMRPGDVCFDADGVLLRRGADFRTARYPVVIARPNGVVP